MSEDDAGSVEVESVEVESVEVESGVLDFDVSDLDEDELFGDDGAFVLAEDLSEGDVLNDIYRLGDMLGEGAMGRIFEAQDLDLNRRVAIKVPLIEEAVDILIAEARAMAALRHKNLPVVHAAGKHHGVNYLVMERLSGVDLDRHLTEVYDDGFALGFDEVVEILICITDALTAIHHAGVAHRDIKPENVLLCKRGPVLIDFGLVAPATADEAIQGGSPCYVAPEIIANTAVRSSRHLSDIYSLGIMAYELLSGEVPFDHDDIPKLLAMHLQAPTPDVRKLRPNTPDALAALITEMMSKAPVERPSAEEALWALKAIAKQVAKRGVPEPEIIVASEDIALVGRISKLVKEWHEEGKVRVCKSSDAVFGALLARQAELMLVDVALQDMSGMELLMQLPEDIARPHAMVALTKAGSKDLALLSRFGVHAAIARGESLEESLFKIFRNCVLPRPKQEWLVRRSSRMSFA